MHVVVTGVNARTLDLTTGVDGTVSFSYDGPNLGHDTVTVTAAINGPVVQSNTIDVVWASSVGTPCTGRTTPLDVILVIDGSPSMFNGNNVGPAKVATDRFIDDLDFTRDQVAAVLFSGDAQLYAPLTTDGALAKTEINAALEGFAHACDGFCFGGSNFAAALNTALAEFQGPRHRAASSPLMIFVSDGGNTGVDFAPEIAQLRALGVKVVTIGLGSDVDSLVMRRIASSTNDYFYSPTTAELEWLYNNVNPGYLPQPPSDCERGREPGGVRGSASGLPDVERGDSRRWGAWRFAAHQRMERDQRARHGGVHRRDLTGHAGAVHHPRYLRPATRRDRRVPERSGPRDDHRRS